MTPESYDPANRPPEPIGDAQPDRAADQVRAPYQAAPPTQRPGKPWQFKLLSISFALFCLEVGAFLIIFPQQETWNLNYFSGLSPWVQDVWDAAYFRWAVSGIGFLNVYVAFLQIRNLFRSDR